MKRATVWSEINNGETVISIHALVKRATSFLNGDFSAGLNFNPRPREEGDQRYYTEKQRRFYFNPRPREEGDKYVRSIYLRSVRISIHALVKRATN